MTPEDEDVEVDSVNELNDEILKLKYQIIETQKLYYQSKLETLVKDKIILDLLSKNIEK